MSADPHANADLRTEARRLETQLRERALPWWAQTLDRRAGGYLLTPTEKQLATQSRMVWVFSHAHGKGFGDYLPHATGGLEFVLDRFRDRRHGGFFWKTDRSGRALSEVKILYGHLFVVYALVEYGRASGDRAALDEARSVAALLAERAHDRAYGGWLEHFRRSWRAPRRWTRGLEVEVPGLKSANAHLHVVEALSELARETADGAVAALLAEAVDVCTRYFFPDDPAAASIHRTREWRPAGRPGVSHGHNVELAWLLVEAEETLSREPSRDRLDRYLAHTLAARRPKRIWWEEAELLAALVARLARWESPEHAEALRAHLAFVLDHLVDPADGVWLQSVADDGRVLEGTRVSIWKDAYHEVRATTTLLDALAAPARA